MLKEIKDYIPQNDFEAKDKEMMIQVYETYGNALFERFNLFHFSASAMVFNKTYTKVLMIHHKIYNSWAWMGGHMDGKYNFYEVAKKEVSEESGVKDLHPIYNHPVSIEILPVWQHYKNGEALSSHQHMNVSFAFMADEDDSLIKNIEETNGVKWIEIEKLDSIVEEPLMIPIYKKIIKRVLNEKISNI